MKQDAYILLQLILQGKLFAADNCIICAGSNFPFWFFFYSDKYLKNNYAIEKIVFMSYVDFMALDKNPFPSFFDDVSSVSSQKKLYVVSLQKDDLQKKASIFKKIKQKIDYFIVYIHYSDIYLLDDVNYFNLNSKFQGVQKIYLKDYYRVISYGDGALSTSYFFDFLYDACESYCNLEFFFSLLPYILLINKKYLTTSVKNYVSYIWLDSISHSLFDLATFFFQKKQGEFFLLWNVYKYKYSVEFWLYFWSEQCMYAQLFLLLLHKKIDDHQLIHKKINRWFSKYGVKEYTVDVINTYLLALMMIDSRYKKYQTNPLVHLDSFFLRVL
jgi:hypothetical protein